jgi:hypothetical protein
MNEMFLANFDHQISCSSHHPTHGTVHLPQCQQCTIYSTLKSECLSVNNLEFEVGSVDMNFSSPMTQSLTFHSFPVMGYDLQAELVKQFGVCCWKHFEKFHWLVLLSVCLEGFGYGRVAYDYHKCVRRFLYHLLPPSHSQQNLSYLLTAAIWILTKFQNRQNFQENKRFCSLILVPGYRR